MYSGDEFYGDDITSGIEDWASMYIEEPAEVKALREQLRARLDNMSNEEYNEWLDGQTDEAGLRYDAQHRS